MTTISYYKSLKQYILNNWRTIFNQFVFIYLVITLCYIGLAFVNYAYADDNNRPPNDNRGWFNDARYIMHYTYQLFTVNLNRAVAVASPYTYFVSTAFLSLASLILVRYFNRKNIYISLIIASFLAITPFYWANMLYLLDRLGMALSLFWAIAIPLFSYKLNHKNAFIFQLITLFIFFFLYQIMLLSYILLVAFLFCYSLIENKLDFKTIVHKALISISSLTLVTIVYWILDKLILVHFKSAYGASATTLPRNLGSNHFINTLQAIFNYQLDSWQNHSFGYLIPIIMLLFLALFIYHFYQTKPKLGSIALFTIALVLILLTPTLVLVITNREVSSRFCYAFGSLLCLALLYFYNNTHHKTLHKVALVLTILLLFNCLAMASYLSNRLQHQMEYEQEISTLLHEDIYQLEKHYPNLKNLYLSEVKNLIKIVDLPTKPAYLPEINKILSPGFTSHSSTKSKLRRVRVSRDRLNREPSRKILDKRYYTIFYYPRLNMAEVRYKAETVY